MAVVTVDAACLDLFAVDQHHAVHHAEITEADALAEFKD
jgi:hypothetical protein